MTAAVAGTFAPVAAMVVGFVVTSGGEDDSSESVAGSESVDGSGTIVPGDQVLVQMQVRSGAGRDVAERVAATVSGELVGQIELIDLWQIRIPPTDLAGLESVTSTPLDGTWTGELIITYMDPDVAWNFVPEMDPGNAYSVVWVISATPDGGG